jgi:hypothetical protein
MTKILKKHSSPFEGLYVGQMLRANHHEKYGIEIHSKDFMVVAVKEQVHNDFESKTTGVKVFLRYDEMTLPKIIGQIQNDENSIFELVEVVPGMNQNDTMEFWISLTVKNIDSSGNKIDWGDGLNTNTPKIIQEIKLLENLRKYLD